MKGKKDLLVYMSEDQHKWMGLAIVFGLLIMLRGGGVEWRRLGLALSLLGLLYFGHYLWSVFHARSYVREIEQEGILDSVLQDFENAKPSPNGKLYFGEDYLFGQGSGRVIRYDEVCQIWQYNYFRTGQWCLKFKLNSGEMFNLCVLHFVFRSPREEDVAQLRDAVALICSHNPEIHSDPEIHRI